MRSTGMISAFVGYLLWGIPTVVTASVQEGDQEFARVRYPVAEAFYISALNTSPDSAEVLWRLARVNVCIADVSPPEEKLDRYRRAEAFAFRCIAADSMKSEGHTWLAAALGNIAMFEGGKTKVKLCHAIKKELDCSIALNPRDDIAYSILGSFYMALGNVGWFERQLATVFLGSLPEGGYDESERALKKAIALSPNVIRHHFVLGELYVEQERTPEALAQFQLVASLPVLLASDRRTQLSAVGLMRDLKKEEQ